MTMNSHFDKRYETNIMSSSSLYIVFAVLALSLVSSVYGQSLYYDYYDNTPSPCRDFEEIVALKVREWFEKDKTIAASLIRLHFHDCAVRGCDASILLNYIGSERTAKASKTLRGFHVIDEIKKELEKKCPRTVSCADILTAVARDATVLLKGPFWANKYGRKDGYVSLAQDADNLPKGHENVTALVEFFQSLGLSVLDLAVLSGAHTVGRCSCGSIQDRLYNFQGTNKPDPSIAPTYLNYLRRKCKNPAAFVDLDPKTPYKFDSEYYKNLGKNMGLLYTDQKLYNDHRTYHIVDTLGDQANVFRNLFSSSMVKLGDILGDADDDGEVRLHCSRINP